MTENRQSSIDNNLTQSENHDSPILPRWLIKLCEPRRMLWLGPLLGFLLSVPFIFSGYKCDDYIFKQQTNRISAYYHARPVWDYFNWIASDAETAGFRERGILNTDWFAPDNMRWHFFRPLASLVHAFQFRFFGNSPWIMHFFLALLYSLLIFMCAKLLLRFSSSSIAIGIAILIFAIDDIHSYSSGWISQYNTMLCCVFGIFAFLMHDRWRSRKSAAGLLLFIAGFVLALLSSEGGLALMGYVVAYALFMEPGTKRNKAMSLIPGALIAVGYLVFYFSQHFGTKCNMAYLSPMDNPALSIYTIVTNTLIFSLSQVLSIAPVTAVLQNTGLAGTGAAIVLCIWILYVFRKFFLANKTAAFYCTGMVLSIMPFTLGFISDRLLLWAGLGGAGLIGELLTARSAATGKTQRIFAKTFLFTNTVVSLIFFVPMLFMLWSFANSAMDLEKTVSREDTILLNSSNGFAFMYAPVFRCEKGKEWPEHFYYLYCGADTMLVKRTGERTLQVSIAKGWMADTYSRSRRSKEYYFKQGDTFNLQLMTAVIEQVTPDGRPLRVNFTFNKDPSEFEWLKWNKKEPEECELPAIGEEMWLAAPPVF